MELNFSTAVKYGPDADPRDETFSPTIDLPGGATILVMLSNYETITITPNADGTYSLTRENPFGETIGYAAL